MSEPTLATPPETTPETPPGAPSGGTPPSLRGPGVAGTLLHRFRGFGGALAALLVMVVYLSVTQEFFATKANILNVLSGNSAMMITAIGLTFIVLSAGFDLSVGAIYAAAGYVAFRSLDAGLPPIVALLLGGAMGMFLGGVVNGILIGRLRLNFFVVTLGTSSLFTGALNVVTNGKTSSINESETSLFYRLGNGSVLTIPVPVILSLVVLVISLYVLRLTSFGRAIYAVGGNPEAARLAGINVSWVYVCVYGIGGLLAATAGMVDASRLASASPTAGATLALTAGSAVLLGGTSFYGGVGGVGGTVIGVLLIAILQNGLGLMGVSAFWQGVVTGIVLIVAVLLDKLQSRSAS